MRREETFAVGQHVELDVELTSGTVVLRAGESGSVRVSVDSSNADLFDVTQHSDGIAVRQRRRSNARIFIDAPIGTDASVKGTSVDLNARGALGTLRMRTTSGRIDGDDVVRVDASSVSGDVRFDLVRQTASLTSKSGSIDVRHVGGRFNAITSSGDISVGSCSGDIESVTVSGDIQIGRCDGSNIDARSVSGTISLGLPSGIRVDPNLSTLSGKVSLPKPAAAPSLDPTTDRRSVRVRLHSISGDLRIERAG